MWFLCQEPCKTLDQARKRAMEIGRENFGSIHKECYGLFFKRTVYVVLWWKWIEKEAVHYWMENISDMQKQGIGLYFYSSTKGSGKTRMVCSLANELIEKHQKQVKFSTSMKILDEIKSTWGKRYSPDKTEEQLIDELARADILIIDDFGTETEKDWVNEKYYEIIDGRYTSRKITIFTSNYCISRLNYDERITNRILERSLEIPFPEESVREHIAETMKQQMIAGIMGGEK